MCPAEIPKSVKHPGTGRLDFLGRSRQTAPAANSPRGPLSKKLDTDANKSLG